MANKLRTRPKDIVFTALFGGYETLNELTFPISANTRYICFTDNPELKSETWEIWVVKPSSLNDAARSSREIKMLGHRYFELGSRSLYIDNSVKLKVDGAVVLDDWLIDNDLAFMSHSTRKNVRGEFFVCAIYGLDSQKVILEQFLHYTKMFPHLLKQKPYWGGMIARRSGPVTEKFMTAWDEQYRAFTRRDQLSINAASLISGVVIRRINGSNASTLWHQWPIHSERKLNLRDTTSDRKLRKMRIIKNAIIYGFRFYLPL
jgi:hypothetical protein